MILVDSDWIIDDLSGRKVAIQALAAASRQGVAITIAEVYEGAYLHLDPLTVLNRYRRFLEGYHVMPVTREIAGSLARIRASLRKSGNLLPDVDLHIAPTAIVHDLTLLTRNQRHFARVSGLRLYDDGQRSFGTTPVS